MIPLATQNTFISSHLPSKLFCCTKLSRAVSAFNTITVAVGNASNSLKTNYIHVQLKIMTLLTSITDYPAIKTLSKLTASRKYGALFVRKQAVPTPFRLYLLQAALPK
jgi:hypothetical protein